MHLPIALAQVNTIRKLKTSENLQKKIRQITHFLYQVKEKTKRSYNNRMASIKLWKQNGCHINEFWNSKISDPRRALLNLAVKTMFNLPIRD